MVCFLWNILGILFPYLWMKVVLWRTISSLSSIFFLYFLLQSRKTLLWFLCENIKSCSIYVSFNCPPELPLSDSLFIRKRTTYIFVICFYFTNDLHVTLSVSHYLQIHWFILIFYYQWKCIPGKKCGQYSRSIAISIENCILWPK